MPRGKIRDEAGYQVFIQYLSEAGFEPVVREICLEHAVTPRDTYLDARGPTCHAARLVIWWWLHTSFRKSFLEIARIYDRDHSSISQAVKKFKERGNELGTPVIELAVAHRVAKIISTETMENLQRAGRQLAEYNNRRTTSGDDS